MTDKDRIEQLEDALRRIYDWSRAYPIAIFPEPDWNKARVLLDAGGMTLDSVSASNMRLVMEGVGKIAEKALKPRQPVPSKMTDIEGARLANWLADYSHDLMEGGDLDQEAAELERAAQWISDHLKGNSRADP